jgi:acyl carrier protein
MDDQESTAAANWPDDFDKMLRVYCRLSPEDGPIEPGQSLTSLGADSLAQIAMIADIEDTFAVAFPPAMLTGEVFDTPATVWAAVCELRAAPAADS